MSDTIFALSTPYAKSGIAVIRISGPKALDVLKLFGYHKTIKPRYATYVQLHSHEDKQHLDNAIAIYFKAPHSFTGEDMLELQVHGSIGVINSILSELHKMPFLRTAKPGEFTQQALLNGKMDIIQVEALSDLIESETAMQSKAALRQFSGQLNSLYDDWRQKLISIMAQLEAYIDFPDEDIPETVLTNADQTINQLKNEIKEHIERSEYSSSILSGIKIAILGEPNAGKSSVLNLLSKTETAIVSHTPGTTRDIIQCKIEINGLPIILHDTAGIRETHDLVEQEGIKRAKLLINDTQINIFIFDISKDNCTYFDNNLLNKFINTGKKEFCICILNKIDLINIDDDKKFNEYIKLQAIKCKESIKNAEYNDYQIIAVSAKDEKSSNIIMNAIQNIIHKLDFNIDEPITTKIRQLERLRECLLYLNEFNLNKGIEISVQDIRFAAESISILTGSITTDEILDELFSNFCIGK